MSNFIEINKKRLYQRICWGNGFINIFHENIIINQQNINNLYNEFIWGSSYTYIIIIHQLKYNYRSLNYDNKECNNQKLIRQNYIEQRVLINLINSYKKIPYDIFIIISKFIGNL
jgi:hypothetical protein